MQQQIEKLLSLSASKRILNYLFSMQAVIGRGSFGVVYVGRQIDTGQAVAIKVVPISFLSSDIQRETDIMRDLDSPNVVKLIEVLRTDNNFYIMTELCNGGDLKEYMRIHGAFGESTSLSILIQILRGILQTFKKGVIHRDLKPANILLTHTKNQQIIFKLADFGFAKRFTHLENDLMDSLVGTPLYMSPQVLLRRQYSSKCDVWSIGLIYYELLEGKIPWDAKDIIDLINMQIQTKISFKNSTPQSQQFILGCLQYEEAHRFSWEQLFTHPVFQSNFNKQPLQLQQCHGKKQSAISLLRNRTVPNQIDQLGKCTNIGKQYLEDVPKLNSEMLKNIINFPSDSEQKDRVISVLSNTNKKENEQTSIPYSLSQRETRNLNEQFQTTSYEQKLVDNEFLRNKIVIFDNLNYLKYLIYLRTSLQRLFKTSPTLVKLVFLLSKHAMIISTILKVQMIDRGKNDLGLREFIKFKNSQTYLQLEKYIVESHFVIFNQFQDNFLYLNENLSFVINDTQFQDIFNNNLEPTISFSSYAQQLTSKFIEEYISQVGTSESTFSQAIQVYCDHLLHYKFSQTDIQSVMMLINQTTYLNMDL